MLILTKTQIILPVFVIVFLCIFLSSEQFIRYSVHKSCCGHNQTLVLQALVKPLAYVTTYIYCAAQSNQTAAQCSI